MERKYDTICTISLKRENDDYEIQFCSIEPNKEFQGYCDMIANPEVEMLMAPSGESESHFDDWQTYSLEYRVRKVKKQEQE